MISSMTFLLSEELSPAILKRAGSERLLRHTGVASSIRRG